MTTMIRALGALALLLLMAAQARAKGGGATDAIRDANGRLRVLLAKPADKGSDAERKLTAEVTRELRDLFDIADLTERALADHWKTMSAADRDEVVETLRAVVERNYLVQLRGNLAYEIVYGAEETTGDDRLVKTVVKAERKGRPFEIQVDYMLRKDGGAWRVYDVITDGVSLLANYRSQFNRIIKKEGVKGLIARMKTKLEK